MSQYISIENFFLKETFSKVRLRLLRDPDDVRCLKFDLFPCQALKMSTASSDGKTTSVVDDGFFIIHKCLKYVMK